MQAEETLSLSLPLISSFLNEWYRRLSDWIIFCNSLSHNSYSIILLIAFHIISFDLIMFTSNGLQTEAEILQRSSEKKKKRVFIYFKTHNPCTYFHNKIPSESIYNCNFVIAQVSSNNLFGFESIYGKSNG